MVFFKEKLSRFQWLSVMLALTGVFIQVLMVGSLPWISLVLAITFSIYGVLRKMANVDSFAGLMIETLALFPVAAYYLFMTDSQTGHLLNNSFSFNIMLMLAGLVTTTPLVFFSAAASRLNLSSLGFLQYITPSMIWLLAVFVYHEPISQSVLVTFCFIWAALFCFSLDGIYQRRNIGKFAVASSRSS
jgi:chloramphenicol-sensitive protein RarD